MRKLVLLLLSASSFNNCISQEQPQNIYRLDSIPESGVKLDKQWEFRTGDTPPWVKAPIDLEWYLVNPTLPIHEIPLVMEAHMGWFRLVMKIDSSLFNEEIALVYTSKGASEIYLDGKSLYRFGMVSSNFESEQTRLVSYRPLTFKLGNKPIQELAVRYSFNKKNLHVDLSNSTCVQIILKDNNRAFADYIRYEGLYQNVRSIQLSFYLPLGFLLLFFYLSYRSDKAYFFIGTFCFFMFLGILFQVIGGNEALTVNVASSFLLAQQAVWISGLMLLLTGTYILLKQKRSWFYYCLIVYSILIFPTFFVFYKWTELFGQLITPLVIIEFLRCSLKAVKQRRPGALILVHTGIICLFMMVTTIYFQYKQEELSRFAYAICFVMPPMGLSLFFAGEFARTGKALQLRLLDVEQLSKKTIIQEKEKQQLLVLQNETLEQKVAEKTSQLIQQHLILEAEKEAKLLAEFNRRLSESELKALRSQMNPHFVFNILNTIESYALENNKQAASCMIQKFSRLTRMVLENSMSQLVPFENDWKALQYVELEQQRYADKFLVKYDVEQQVLQDGYCIPPMIIQPFVENAIIHGLRNKIFPIGILSLSASLSNSYIILKVEDNGIGRAKAASLKASNPIQKTSLGIKVTEDRISIFNNLNQQKKASINIQDLHSGTRVIINLPAIDHQFDQNYSIHKLSSS